MSKKQLGQFFTTNYKYILQNMFIPDGVENIIEPFAGNGDLLNFIETPEKYKLECYDIEPKKEFIIQQDTLLNPPDYTNKFILTNPPYLARNKSKNKQIFDKYDVNDLYKCFIKQLITSVCLGGIIIIPLNFWSSIRKNDIRLRKHFLKKYNIVLINIFEEKVFDDTSYTICSFQFELRDSKVKEIPIDIYPSKKRIIAELNKENNYTIGGEIYNLPINKKYRITRLLADDVPNTNILVKCIDDNIKNKICLKIVDNQDLYYDTTPNKSARTYATLLIEPAISAKEQKELVDKFNQFLNEKREKYHSLFLANYRESNTIARKRISFDLVYQIVGYLLNQS